MHRAQAQVRQFCLDVVHAPTSPARPALRDARLRARLILEEAMETVAGLVGRFEADVVVEEVLCDSWEKLSVDSDLVEVVDGLCDLVYVAYGTAEAIGVDLEPYFGVVHAANMAKEDRAVDAHGKRGGKPAGWVDPKVEIQKMLTWRDRT